MKYLFAFALFFTVNLMADEALPPPPERGFTQTFVLLALMALATYFIMIRPAQKQRKALETQQSSLKKGDKVVAMGIVGTVDKIQDDTVILRMFDGSKIEVLKRAITDVTKSQEKEEVESK